MSKIILGKTPKDEDLPEYNATLTEVGKKVPLTFGQRPKLKVEKLRPLAEDRSRRYLISKQLPWC